MSRIDPQAGRYLKDVRPLEVSLRRVTVGLDPEFATELERLNNPHVRLQFAKTLGEVLERDVEVEVRLLPAADPSPPNPDAGSVSELQRRWLQDPTVFKVMEAFSGQIVEVR